MPNRIEWQSLVEGAGDIVLAFAADGRVVYANERARLAYGYSSDEFLQLRDRDLQGSDDRSPAVPANAGGAASSNRIIHRTKDGNLLHLEVSYGKPCTSDEQYRLMVARDVSHRLVAESEHRLFSSVFESSPEAIVIADAEQRILAVNPAFSHITGYGATEVIGKRPSLLSSGRHEREFYERMWHDLGSKGHWQGEIWNRRRDGEIYPQWQTITVVRDPAGRPANYVAIFADISERKAAEARISHLAYHDP
jgi:PAS domain S-box-containing protein